MAASDPPKTITGGCLCREIRYELTGAPSFSGLCYCGDCQKSSGSAFVGFMGYDAAKVKLEPSPNLGQYKSKSCRDTERVINFCKACGSLIFGGIYGEDHQHTIYAGTLDAEFREEFKPTMAIFTADRPKWAKLEAGLNLKEYETMP